MSTPAPRRRARNALAFGSALAALITLSACDPREAEQADTAALFNTTLPPLPDALPMTTASEPLIYAPAAERLPAARQLAYADPGDQGYAWIDRADTIFDVVGDAPPDYGFDYDDVEPWGWEAASGYVTYAEPIDDGYYRYYYYEPGADDPYLVRDPWYSYGYSDGRIAAVYDAGGALLPLALAMQRVDYGSRYYARAHDLRRAARRARRGVAAPVWAARRPAIVRARQQWASARERQPAWREWRQRDTVRAQRRQLREERDTRRAAAVRFANWQRDGLRGGAPPLYRPSRPAERLERQTERTQRQAQRAQLQADRVARQAQRAQFMEGGRQGEITAAQHRRREMMQPRLDPQRGAERTQVRAERQAERTAQRQARMAARADQTRVQAREQQRATRQAQRAQLQAQRQQQAVERQRRQGEVRQRAERQQQRDAGQLARRQQGEQRRSQGAAAQQRAQLDSAQRQQHQAQRAQMEAAREQQRAARQQAMATRQQQAAARQQQMAAARQQQAAARQQQMAARQQAAQQRQQSRQAAAQARAERRAQGGGGGGERRGRRD